MQILISDPRQDAILQEFVDQGKWKTALDHCDKRVKKLKKGTDHRLQLNHFLIDLKFQLAQGTLQKEDVIRTVASHPAFVEYLESCDDFEFVEHIEDAFNHVGNELWKKAIDIQPNSEEVFQAWFDVKFKRLEFSDAAEACMRWRVKFPEKGGELMMRMIFCYHLSSKAALHVSDADGVPMAPTDKDARMAVFLARQIIKSTPAKTPKDSELASTADLGLVTHVLTRNELYEEAITLLNDPAKGLKSKLGCWDLMRLNGGLLQKTGRYKDLHSFCCELLDDALKAYTNQESESFWTYGEAGDDSLITKLAILATTELKDEKATQEVEKLLQGLSDAGSFNACLQMVDFKARFRSDRECLKAAQDFYGAYQSKGQVAALLKHLPAKLQNDFSSLLANNTLGGCADNLSNSRTWSNTIISRVNNLRMRYDLVPDKDWSIKALASFVLEGISIYMAARASEKQKPPADNCIADPVLIVAARALIRLSYMGEKQALHQARILLESMVQYSKYNYEALLLLVRICKFQGAAARAFSYYKRLEMKNTQQMNEASIFLRGLSSLHPLASPKAGFDPESLLDGVLAWASKRKSTVGNQALACVDNKNWVEAAQAIAFAADWIQAPGYVCAVAEAYRMQLRSNSDKDSPAPSMFAAIVQKFSDPTSGYLLAKKIPLSQEVPLTYGEEIKLLQKSYNTTVKDSVEATLLIAGLRSIVREIPSDLGSKQLHAILHGGVSHGNVMFSTPVLLTQCILQEKPGRRMNDRVLDLTEKVLAIKHESISKMVNGKTPQEPLHPECLADSIRKVYDFLDHSQLFHDVIAWADRRGNLPKAIKEKATEIMASEKKSATQWANALANSLEEEEVERIKQSVMDGKVGEALRALVGESAIALSTRENCASAAETLRALALVASS